MKEKHRGDAYKVLHAPKPSPEVQVDGEEDADAEEESAEPMEIPD